MDPSGPSSNKSWVSLALGIGREADTFVMLMALENVCPDPPWQSHKFHLRMGKSIGRSAVTLTNARRSYCPSIKDENPEMLTMAQVSEVLLWLLEEVWCWEVTRVGRRVSLQPCDRHLLQSRPGQTEGT